VKTATQAPRIRWIFFDVGGTLFDEEPVLGQQELLIHELLNKAGCEVSDREWASAVRAARRHFVPRHAAHLIWLFTEDLPLYRRVASQFERRMGKLSYTSYRKLAPPLPRMREMLLELRGRFKLGTICNQPAAIRRKMQDEGFLDLFEVHAISAEMDLRKPDLRFYQAALAMAHCQPEECAMVGDRLDNDIFPARALGMTTVRLKAGPHRHQPVLSPEYLPDYTVSSTAELAKLLSSDRLVPQPEGAEIVW
jgi:HAD superfamily hydrolase (TIGR01509 family)